jgi:hypothetical protein
MFSGDIEFNPGPVFLYSNFVQTSRKNNQTKLSSNVVLEQGLKCYQLKN